MILGRAKFWENCEGNQNKHILSGIWLWQILNVLSSIYSKKRLKVVLGHWTWYKELAWWGEESQELCSSEPSVIRKIWALVRKEAEKELETQELVGRGEIEGRQEAKGMKKGLCGGRQTWTLLWVCASSAQHFGSQWPPKQVLFSHDVKLALGPVLWWRHPLQSQEPFLQVSQEPEERKIHWLWLQRSHACTYLYMRVSATPRHAVHFFILDGFFFLYLFFLCLFSFSWDLKLRSHADGKHLPVLCAWKKHNTWWGW